MNETIEFDSSWTMDSPPEDHWLDTIPLYVVQFLADINSILPLVLAALSAIFLIWLVIRSNTKSRFFLALGSIIFIGTYSYHTYIKHVDPVWFEFKLEVLIEFSFYLAWTLLFIGLICSLKHLLNSKSN